MSIHKCFTEIAIRIIGRHSPDCVKKKKFDSSTAGAKISRVYIFYTRFHFFNGEFPGAWHLKGAIPSAWYSKGLPLLCMNAQYRYTSTARGRKSSHTPNDINLCVKIHLLLTNA